MEAKSKADETEKERLWVKGRWGVAPAGFEAERGSSADKESLREEDMPEGEDEREALEDVGVEDAREASSRESRGR